MMSFFEYDAWRQINGLPDSATMLARMGISATVPHEVEVKRMVKRWNKQAVVPASAKAQARPAQQPDGRGQPTPGPATG